MIAFLLAIINHALIDNVILSRFYGICPFLGVSKKSNAALGMGLSVMFVIVLATLITYPIYKLLVKADIVFLDTITFILVIASLVQFLEMFMNKYFPKLHSLLGIYLPLITTNCAVLGVALTNANKEYSFTQSLANALGTSLGFLIVIYIFSCIRERLDALDIPKPFKGVGISLVVASIMALAFYGFTGMIK